MEKANNNDYSSNLHGSFHGLDYCVEEQQQFMKPRSIGETSGDNNNQMIDYMLNNPQQQQSNNMPSGFCGSSSYDKLSFADVMQFADFGPKLALNQSKVSEEDESGIDPVYFLKFPVLNERLQDESLVATNHQNVEENREIVVGGEEEREDEEIKVSENPLIQIKVLGEDHQKSLPTDTKNKRKRPRSTKTSEEVESQRMTHIAVERNRRKQMNEHLRVLRSLMPGSYVQRGDQASIIGGAIEFVRELEQLLQCLESQKRRRLYGDTPRPAGPGGGDSTSMGAQQSPQQPPLIFPTIPLGEDQIELIDNDLMREETAESKSVLADVEVRALGFDAMIKILCRRRPGQLIKMIAALEDLQLNILHTNITTIEQTVLYSFNVKVNSETRFTADDIANSVQQILTFIHTNNTDI